MFSNTGPGPDGEYSVSIEGSIKSIKIGSNSTKGEITIRVNGVDYKPITETLVYDNSEDKLTNATCDGEAVKVDTKTVAGWGEAIYCSLLQFLGVEDTGEEE